MTRTIAAIITFFALALHSLLSEARLPKDSDLPSLTEYEFYEYDVKRDGTYSVIYENRTAVLTEGGRDAMAVRTVGFNDRASKFELLDAQTINGDVTTPVGKSGVEIKEVGDSKVFDVMKQAIISFPKVQVGSRISYRYKITYREVPITNFFSTGLLIELENLDVFRGIIRSERPLSVSISDKMDLLNVQQRQEKGKSVVEITNKTKIRLGIVQEDSPYMDNDRLPSVLIATNSDWKEFAKDIIVEQEKELAKPLPEPMLKIKEKAMREPPERRMAVVSTLLAEEFRYFGDWRRRRGGHIPRALKDIAETKYGDCKDMSLSVVAIARAMGLKADIAWIWRGENYIDGSYYRLPNEFSFNHAIARVEDGGRTHWVDATNAVALPGATLADIAQRPVLVLDKAGVRFENTPDLKSEASQIRIALDYKIRPNGNVDVEGKLTQKGQTSVRSEWALLHTPREQFEYEIARWLARNEKLVSYKLDFPEKASRVARDLETGAKFTINDLGLTTTAGTGFPLLRGDIIDALLIEAKDRFSDLWIGAPNTLEENYLIRGASIVGKKRIGCDLKNEWVRLKRSVEAEKGGTRVISRYEVLKSIVPNSAFRDAKFLKFQREARACFHRSAVILSLPSRQL